MGRLRKPLTASALCVPRQVPRPTAASAPGRLCFRPILRQRALRPPLPPPRLLVQQQQGFCASAEQAHRCQCPEPALLTRRHWCRVRRARGLAPPLWARPVAAAAVRWSARPWGGRGCLAGREETQCPLQTALAARDGRTGPALGTPSGLGAEASLSLGSLSLARCTVASCGSVSRPWQ